MIAFEIPGRGNLKIASVVCDLNGTLAQDGKILPGVKKRLNTLSEIVEIYNLTADTQGTARKEIQGLKSQLVKISGKDSKQEKWQFLKTINPKQTAVIGNGCNDELILRGAVLGIGILQSEGISAAALKNADIVVKNIVDAFDLLLKPKRLIATLRG